MPSANINEEPRYDGLDTQQQQLLSNTSDATCSNPTADLSKDNDSDGDNDLAPQTHVSEGFEPATYPDGNETAPTSEDTSTTNGRRSFDQNRLDNNANIDTHCSDNPIDSRNGSQEAVDSLAGASSEIIQPNNHHTSNNDNNTNRNRHYREATSSSPLRIVNKFSNIVTRISKAFANSASLTTAEQSAPEELPKVAFANRRSLERTWKLMDKVVKCCQHPRMKLNNSPPFILDILPETFKYLKLIHTKYDSQQLANASPPLNDHEYSQVFLKNLQNRCELTLKLFKDAKDEIYNEDSEYRHKLIRNTLVFNHILSELKDIYPNGLFIGDKYPITKKESAGEFWRNIFGSDVIMVNWKTFYHALQQVHSIDSSFFSLNALKQTIDLTCDDHISIFEFDVFTRLFQPWSTLLKNWQTLAITHPGYKAFLTYDELKARLQKHIDKPGSYVFRLSCTRLGQWAIGYVTQDGQILQTIVQNISLSQALTETEFYVYPDGKEEDPDLRERLRSGMTGDERNVIVTEEQYEIYCGIGNSFQTCKICFVNDKEIRVEPCNHLLCTSCLLSWQESDGQGCPYCRTEIKETVQITMDLPSSKSGRKV